MIDRAIKVTIAPIAATAPSAIVAPQTNGELDDGGKLDRCINSQHDWRSDDMA